MNDELLLKKFFDAVASSKESGLSFRINSGTVSLETDCCSSRVVFAVDRCDNAGGIDYGVVNHQQLADFIRTQCATVLDVYARKGNVANMPENEHITDLQQQLLERAHVIARDTERIRQLEHVCRLMAKTLRNYPEHAWIVEEFEKVVGE